MAELEVSKKRKLENGSDDVPLTDSNPKAAKRAKVDTDSNHNSLSAASKAVTEQTAAQKEATALTLDPSLSAQVIFLTGNKGKLKEVQNYLGDDLAKYITNYKVDLEEIQGDEEEIMRHKLEGAKLAIIKLLEGEHTKKALYILVEDTSLFLDQYSKKFNFPGPFCKFLLKANGVQGYLDMVKGHDNRSCTAQCLFGMLKVDDSEGAKPLFFKGECHGKIPEAARGDDGFGWDPIFEFKDNGKTFAEMTVEEKNKISHRANALKLLKAHLDKELVLLNKQKKEEETLGTEGKEEDTSASKTPEEAKEQ